MRQYLLDNRAVKELSLPFPFGRTGRLTPVFKQTASVSPQHQSTLSRPGETAQQRDLEPPSLSGVVKENDGSPKTADRGFTVFIFLSSLNSCH
jgi:hypothetical protein